ncbi:MAG: alpha/beta hydrolase [Chloroflexi bacterium]|nr:alpha/beta hydrolase [Chloroflexota bacterium]
MKAAPPSSESARHLEGQFAGAEGQLYWQAWKPDAAPKALLIIVHGFDDHSSRYAHVADFFAARGFVVYAFDQIGNGKSGGVRGHVNRFDDYVVDLNRFVALAKTQVPDVKTFLIGHSQGGMVVLCFGIVHPGAVSGIVTSAAGMKLVTPAPVWRVALARLLSRVLPTVAQPNGIPLAVLSRDPAMLDATRRDPLRHGVATARWADEFFNGQRDTLANARRFAEPVLMLHGSTDQLISPEATKQFFASAVSRDKQLKIYDGMYHELFNDIRREQVLADVEQWLNAHL